MGRMPCAAKHFKCTNWTLGNNVSSLKPQKTQENSKTKYTQKGKNKKNPELVATFYVWYN